MSCNQTANLFLLGRNRRGLSSIYLMLAIMLSVLIIPTWLISSHFHKEHQTSSHYENKVKINEAVQQWVNEKGYWPRRDLSDIASDKNYLPDGLPANPINGQPYRLDRVTHLVR